jgi:hypothetical protein
LYNQHVVLGDGAGRSTLPLAPLWGVLRGGSFNNNERNARCAYRNNNPIDNLNNNRGFRVVASHASLFFRFQGFALYRSAGNVVCSRMHSRGKTGEIARPCPG